LPPCLLALLPLLGDRMLSQGTKLLGKYEIQNHIGSGRFGEVYQARDLLCDRMVAIKALRQGVYEEEAIKYVLSEFRIMGMLWGHPNVVSIHSIEPGDLVWDDEKNRFTEIKANTTGYLAYIVMEFVAGQNLDKLLEKGRLPIEDALNICLDICNGLAYAHQSRIIHRDVKPQNVLLELDGTAKVGDFSIAKLLEGSSYVGSFVGTSKYMAPEQYDGHYNHQVDIYATGLLLFEAVAGYFPFNGQTKQDLEKQKKRGDLFIPADVPEELEDVIKKSLQPIAEKRFQEVEEMQEALHKAKMILYEKAIYNAPTSYKRQLRKKWKFSGEDELISSLRIVTEDAKAKEEKLRTELDNQIHANRQIEEELRHHQSAKENLEKVVHDYIHETQMQNNTIQELRGKNDDLISSLSEQENEKTKLAKTLQAARREIGRLNRKIEQYSPRAIWIYRGAIVIFALISIGLTIRIGNFLPELDVYKIVNQAYETQIVERGNLITNMAGLQSKLVTSSPGQTPQPTTIGKDGAMMVLIPEGHFVMGDNISTFTGGFIPKFLRFIHFKKSNEAFTHSVYLDNFYIDEYEVTNEQYVKFLNSVKTNESSEGYKYVNFGSEFCLIESSRGKYHVKSGYDKYPVIEVSWYGARDYAKWAEKRLPTEEEWEKAARGGLVGKRYPWGDKIDPQKAHYGVKSAAHESHGNSNIDNLLKPTGSFLPNGYGLYDVVGNVWEWVDYDAEDTKQNPEKLEPDSNRVLRGGGWDSTMRDLYLSTQEFSEPEFMGNNVGFRCAQSIKEGE